MCEIAVSCCLRVLCLQAAAPTLGDAAELEPTELLNPFNAVGLLLGSAVAGAVFMQKKQSEVRREPHRHQPTTQMGIFCECRTVGWCSG